MTDVVNLQQSALGAEDSGFRCRQSVRSALVIVPTYNENDNVAALTTAVLRVSPGLHLLFVDDNSPDGTGHTLDGIAARQGQVHVLHRDRKSGLGRAYVAGFRWALERDYEFILQMDADFSHDPADLPRLLGAATRADLAVGSRYVGGTRVINWSRVRLRLSRGAGLYVRLITGLGLSDPTSGFRCFRRSLFDAIDLDLIESNGYAFQIELAHRAWMEGLLIVEVPITFEERRVGQSKLSWGIILEAVWRVGALPVRSGFKRTPGVPHPRSVLQAIDSQLPAQTPQRKLKIDG